MNTEREEYMVKRYGECVKRTEAARILGRSTSTIRAMLQDGRLDTVCEGKMVCTHSIARYLDAPARADCMARARKLGRRWYIPKEMV